MTFRLQQNIVIKFSHLQNIVNALNYREKTQVNHLSEYFKRYTPTTPVLQFLLFMCCLLWWWAVLPLIRVDLLCLCLWHLQCCPWTWALLLVIWLQLFSFMASCYSIRLLYLNIYCIDRLYDSVYHQTTENVSTDRHLTVLFIPAMSPFNISACMGDCGQACLIYGNIADFMILALMEWSTWWASFSGRARKWHVFVILSIIAPLLI